MDIKGFHLIFKKQKQKVSSTDHEFRVVIVDDFENGCGQMEIESLDSPPLPEYVAVSMFDKLIDFNFSKRVPKAVNKRV